MLVLFHSTDIFLWPEQFFSNCIFSRHLSSTCFIFNLCLGNHLVFADQHGTPLQHLTQNGLVGGLPGDLYISSQKDQNLVDFYPSSSAFLSAFCPAFPFISPQPTQVSSLLTWPTIREILPPRIPKTVKTKASLARKVRQLWST